LKKIAITQRVVLETRINERRDILDQRWTELAEKAGFFLIPVPNSMKDPGAYLHAFQIDGMILSGGNNVGYRAGKKIEGFSLEANDVAYERDYTESDVMNYCLKEDIPLLGVCRGLQFIHSFFGGELISVEREKHVAKRHEIQFSDPFFKSIYGPDSEVNSYHNFGVPLREMPDELKAVAMYDNEAEALRHKHKEIYGIMWHPEREKDFSDKDIIFIQNIFKI
jgi:gamma-glutamyl-gamma-aminobutyrate hydrolase PuuD